MATITYKCSICERDIDLLENKKGLTTMSKCVITYGCKGKMLATKRNPDNIRESFPAEVPGLEDYSPRDVLFNYTQIIPNTVWTINHDMNVSPSVSVYVLSPVPVTPTNPSGTAYLELDEDKYKITVLSPNTITLTFTNAIVGKAQLVSRNSIKAVPTTVTATPTLSQATSNGYFVFAVPKYLTKFEYPPTLLPPPQTPYDLSQAPIRIEVSIQRPNQEEEICTEYLTPSLLNTPWNGWNEVLIRKRRNYYLFSKSILSFRTFGSDNLSFSDIPNGTQLRITRIDYGTGVLQPLESEGLYILLANSPYTINDKIKNQLIDVGDMFENDIDYFSYNNTDFFVDPSNVEKTYPDIIKIQ